MSEVSGWRDISTAPNDPILLGFFFQKKFVRYIGQRDSGGWMQGEMKSSYFPKHMQNWFTHWMHLPAPPTI